MKIGIFGLGAMGSVYATFFAESGHEVIGFDNWKEHTDAIKSSGLRLSGISGDRINRNIKAFQHINNNTNFDDIIKNAKEKAGSLLPGGKRGISLILITVFAIWMVSGFQHQDTLSFNGHYSGVVVRPDVFRDNRSTRWTCMCHSNI